MIEPFLNNGHFVFQNYLEKSNSQIETIVALVRGKLDRGIRITLGALTVIDVHGNVHVQATCITSSFFSPLLPLGHRKRETLSKLT